MGGQDQIHGKKETKQTPLPTFTLIEID